MILLSAGGVIRSMGIAVGGGLGSHGVLRSLSGMYLVSEIGLSGKVTFLSPGASEMKSTAVSCSGLSGGTKRTELLG